MGEEEALRWGCWWQTALALLSLRQGSCREDEGVAVGVNLDSPTPKKRLGVLCVRGLDTEREICVFRKQNALS